MVYTLLGRVQMTEKEFIALLAIEGKTLDVAEAMQDIGGVRKDGFIADVNQGLFSTLATSDFKTTRRSAVQNLIKQYYKHADN